MENERDQLFFDRLKSTNNMGCLLTMNERNEKNRTRPSLAVSNIKSLKHCYVVFLILISGSHCKQSLKVFFYFYINFVKFY